MMVSGVINAPVWGLLQLFNFLLRYVKRFFVVVVVIVSVVLKIFDLKSTSITTKTYVKKKRKK